MRLYETPAQKMNREERTEGMIRAKAIWESLPQEDRQRALEQLAHVQKSKQWLKERNKFYATLSEEKLIRYRMEHLQK